MTNYSDVLSAVMGLEGATMCRTNKTNFVAIPTEEGYVTFCVTEKRTKEEMDAMVELIKEARL